MNQRIKHGPFWTGLFSVISLAWLFPLALVRLVDCASEQRRIENHLRVVPVEHDCSIPDGDVPSVEDG